MARINSKLKGLPQYQSSRHAFSVMMRTEGLAGVYKGYWATLASFGPFSAFYFLFYEQAKVAAARAEQVPVTQISTSSMVSLKVCILRATHPPTPSLTNVLYWIN